MNSELMRESLSTDELYVMKTLDRAPAAPQLEVRAPGTAGPLVDATEMSRFLARWLPTGVSRPTVFAINLEGIYLSPAALRELLVPLGQAARAGTYGDLAVVICTSDTGTIDVARALAQAHNLALYAAPSPERVGEAQPLGPLTPTEVETLEVLWRLGGNVTVASFARETGLAASAATNRLVSIVEKRLAYREERSRRRGILYGDPRVARHTDTLPEELEHELEVYSAITGLTRDELLIAAWREYGQEAGVQAQPGDHALAVAWRQFRRARSEELNERMSPGRAVLDDPGAASIAASGMEADRVERVRRAFE